MTDKTLFIVSNPKPGGLVRFVGIGKWVLLGVAVVGAGALLYVYIIAPLLK
jgi:hypothetical protein